MLEMINKDAAERAMTRIAVGDTVTGNFNGKEIAYLVLSKSVGYYGLICQSPTNRVSMGIACTDVYKQEVEAMRVAFPDQITPPAPRGRPPGSGKKKAPPTVEAQPEPAPTNFLPPGSTADWIPKDAVPVAAPATANGHSLATNGHAPPAPEPAQRQPIEKAEGSDTWLIDALDNAVSTFKEELLVILQSIDEGNDGDNQPTPAPQPAAKTCAECLYVDMDTMPTCTKYNSNPPLNFVFNAGNLCPGYEEMPY